jgi:hypothetical protein
MRRFFSIPSTPITTENIKIPFIFYVTEPLCSLCLGVTIFSANHKVVGLPKTLKKNQTIVVIDSEIWPEFESFNDKGIYIRSQITITYVF